MLTKITDELWLDLDRIIRVARDGDEVKYTIDFKERMVTYCVDLNVGNRLKEALIQKENSCLQYQYRMNELSINHPNGDTA